MVGLLLSAVVVILSLFQPAEPVCSLENGQNAVYWWIPEDHLPGAIINSLPIEGRTTGTPEISLRLLNGSEWFKLDSVSKQLSLVKPVDRESGIVRLDATVECKSQLPKDTFQVNIPIQVKIQDVNDNYPIFSHDQYFANFSEELAIGTPVVWGIKATDLDQEGPNSEVRYSVVQDNPYSALVTFPNPWEGTLAVAQRIDYEKLQNFTVNISAKDSGVPQLESFALVHIAVNDVDDLNPIFEFERYSAAIKADTIPGATISVAPAQIKAKDGDTLNAPITYSLSGEKSALFHMDPKTAAMTLQGHLASSDLVLLTVHATQEDKLERTTSAMLKIAVLANGSVEELKFTSTTYTVEIMENLPVGSKILQTSVTPISPGATYSIKDNIPQFKIDGKDGTIITAAQVDYETNKEFSFTIEVTDGRQYAEATVHVIVANENDNSPIFTSNNYSFTLRPQSGSIIGAVKAADKDIVDTVSYQLLNFNDLFTVDKLGVINMRRTKSPFNGTYELIIVARDSGVPPRQSFTKATVEFIGFDYFVSASINGNSADSTLILVIALGTLVLVLLLLILFLTVYVCKLRKSNEKVRLSRTKIIMANPPPLIYDPNHKKPQGYDFTRGPTVTELPATVEFPDDSPHGSQSPLQEDHGSPQKDKSLSVDYESNAVMSRNLGTRRVLSQPVKVATPVIIPSQLAAAQNGDTLRGTRNLGNSNGSRPPLTVYF